MSFVDEPLVFNTAVNRAKYAQGAHNASHCPFCDVDGLTDVYRTADGGARIWLKNKYPTLARALMTVIIESREHLGDISTYGLAENRRVFSFAFDCWESLISDGRYRSVLMFKNFGPHSGGTLRHPHLQIVGLEAIDGAGELRRENFEGLAVIGSGELRGDAGNGGLDGGLSRDGGLDRGLSRGGVDGVSLDGGLSRADVDVPSLDGGSSLSVNLSTHPVMGFVEFNVVISQLTDVGALADSVHRLTRWLLADYMGGRCDSYNLFFYHFGGSYICKIVPRFITSPYFIGYKIPQVNTRATLEQIASELRGVLSRDEEDK